MDLGPKCDPKGEGWWTLLAPNSSLFRSCSAKGALWAPFTPFGILWAPFGSHLAPIWLPFGSHFAPFGIPFTAPHGSLMHFDIIFFRYWFRRVPPNSAVAGPRLCRAKDN